LIGWIVGEATNRPILRRLCGPLFTILVAVIAAVVVGLDISFNSSILYSGETKKFVESLVTAIDRGHTEQAHEELRKFNDEAIQTYEGGAFLRWLREPTDRLNALTKEDQPSEDDVK
jgi:hypothetical protein